MSISLGDIDFNLFTPDDDGVTWYAALDGWDQIPQRVASIDRPTDHGEITLDNKYAAKQITLQGAAEAVDEDAYWLGWHHIVEATNFLTRFTEDEMLLIVEEDVERQMRVFRTGLQRRCLDSLAFAFEINLRADDPRKYAVVETTLDTSGSAVNNGLIETFPTFTLTAPGTPVLTAGAAVWQAVASLPAGTVIDMAAMTVLDGSTNLMGNVDPASIWFALEPGSTSVGSTVAGTWSWRSAWL